MNRRQEIVCLLAMLALSSQSSALSLEVVLSRIGDQASNAEGNTAGGSTVANDAMDQSPNVNIFFGMMREGWKTFESALSEIAASRDSLGPQLERPEAEEISPFENYWIYSYGSGDADVEVVTEGSVTAASEVENQVLTTESSSVVAETTQTNVEGSEATLARTEI